MKQLVNLPAVTIKEIRGSAIGVIPAGTKFTVLYLGEDTKGFSQHHPYNSGVSVCTGLPGVVSIYNNEFSILSDDTNLDDLNRRLSEAYSNLTKAFRFQEEKWEAYNAARDSVAAAEKMVETLEEKIVIARKIKQANA